MIEIGRERGVGRQREWALCCHLISPLLPLPPTGPAVEWVAKSRRGEASSSPHNRQPSFLPSPRKSLSPQYQRTSSPPSSLPPPPRVASYRRTLRLPSLTIFSSFPRPTLPRGLYGGPPPPPWVAQNGERGAAQDGGSASQCSIRFRCLFSGRLISPGESKLKVGWGASRSRGRKAGEAVVGVGESAVWW